MTAGAWGWWSHPIMREGMTAGAWGGWSHPITSQEADTDEQCSSHFLLSTQSGTPGPRMWLPAFTVPSASIRLLCKHHHRQYPKVCLPGDSKSSDSEDELSRCRLTISWDEDPHLGFAAAVG